MLEPATMRLCNNAVFLLLFLASALSLGAQQKPAEKAPAQAPSLTVDHDPVRSPDAETPAPASTAAPLRKEGEGYILRTDVEEVVLNCTVLEGDRVIQT